MNSSGNTAPRNAGIDLTAALEILSQRSVSHQAASSSVDPTNKNEDAKSQNISLNDSTAVRGCGCCVAGNLDDPSSSLNSFLKFRGQCIDIGPSENDEGAFESGKQLQQTTATDSKENEYSASLWKNQQEQSDAKQRAMERQEELARRLHSMSINDLINTVFQAQEGRVQTYRFFDEALEHILTTGSMQYYPPVCANVTATFSVLSSTINAVRSDLESREDSRKSIREILELLTRLQRAEQSKLQFMAALHLERMRFVAEVQNQKATSNCGVDDSDTVERLVDSGSETEHHGTISKLLNESIRVLRNKTANVIGEINDILEELRYSMPEKE